MSMHDIKHLALQHCDKYKRNGTASYLHALRKYNINPPYASFRRVN